MLNFVVPFSTSARAASAIRRVGSGAMVAATLMLAAVIPAQAQQRVYLRSEAGQPWANLPDSNVNEMAMDTVFGSGGWLDLRYESVNTTTLFSRGTRFIFMEGSDLGADEMEAFLDTNRAAMESWVSGGGALFLNAAPNEGDGISVGFGGAALDLVSYSYSASAVDALHPIFNGPFGTTGTDFSGDTFAHAGVSGNGFSALLHDSFMGANVLSEKAVGGGWIVLGGMTTPNFHNPQTEAINLRNNILSYTDSKANAGQVPEPGTIALLFAGTAPLALAARRRKAV